MWQQQQQQQEFEETAMMLRDSRKPVHQAGHGDNDDDGDDDDDDMLPEDSYFTYRPLSNLPTPPPSSRDSSEAQPSQTALDDGEPLQPKFRGKCQVLLQWYRLILT